MPRAAVVALLLLAGCAGPLRLAATNRMPSVDAVVRLERDHNDNSVLTLTVSHLAPPARLGDGLRTYVVWVSSPDGRVTTSLGMLRTDESQSGWVRGTTPLSEFLIKVTAEPTGDVAAPSAFVVVEGAARRP